MPRPRKIALAIAISVLFGTQSVQACSWAIGYFHQVTALRGRVVGTNIVLFQSHRWLRQSFVRKHAKLTLYEYQSSWTENRVPVKTVVADAEGKFDFGTLRAGHYSLLVAEEKWGHSDWFDVEVKDIPTATESITIDVSPAFTDCKGGHEFLVNAK